MKHYPVIGKVDPLKDMPQPHSLMDGTQHIQRVRMESLWPKVDELIKRHNDMVEAMVEIIESLGFLAEYIDSIGKKRETE